MSRQQRRASPLCAVALAACAALGCATDASSPVNTEAVAWDEALHLYSLKQVKLATLTSLRHLRGGAGSVQTGGAVRASSAAILAKGATVEQLRKQLITSAPSEVDLSFSLQGNVAFPDDLDALQLVTAYYNLEQARAAFATWGVQRLPSAALVAGATLTADTAGSPLDHAEMFFAPLGIHYLPAPDARTQIPVAMNLGAMAHSLAHQSVALFAWAGAPVSPPDLGPARDPEWNSARHVARSMTEGLADFAGAMVTQDAHWLDHSDQQDAVARALDQLQCGKPEMLQALPLNDDQTPYDPYALGSVLSSSLWAAKEAGQPDLIIRGALAALPGIGAAAATGGGKIGIADVLDAIAAASDKGQLPLLCGLFLDRFANLSVASLPSCAGACAQPAERCSSTPVCPQ
jgi:hypothetical protein